MKIKEKIRDAYKKGRTLLKNVKTYWKHPAPGNYIPYKEYLAYIMGASGVQISMQVLNYIAFGSGCVLVVSIFQISITHMAIMGVISLPLGYLMSPLNMLLTDNFGFLSKKVNKIIIIGAAASMIAAVILWFVPSIALERRFGMPAIPKVIAVMLVMNVIGTLYGIIIRQKLCTKYGKFRTWYLVGPIPGFLILLIIVFFPYTKLDYIPKLLILQVVFAFFGMFTYNISNMFQSLTNVLSPSTEERTRINSYGTFFYQSLPSLVSILFPMFASALGGFTSIKTYRVLFPIIAALGFGLSLFLFFGVKEKVVVAKTHRPKIGFIKGSKDVLSNKYFWIQNISSLLGGFSIGVLAVQTIFFIYASRAEGLMGVAAGILGTAYVPGLLLAPKIIKLFGKKNVILVSRAIQVISLAVMIYVLNSGSLVQYIVVNYITILITSISGIAWQTLQADIWDYQQWKTGERLEGFSGVFGYIFGPIINCMALIMPFLYKRAGLSSDLDVMFDAGILKHLIMITMAVTIASQIVTIIPYFFYDLNQEKLDKIAVELRERAKREEESHSDEAQETLVQEETGVKA